MVEHSDSDLMARTRRGDQRAFAEIVDSHKDALINYLTRLGGSRSRAEDLAQEAFLKLYQHADRYEENGKLRGYLYRIATNLAVSAHRKRQRQQVLTLLRLASDNGNGYRPTPQSQVLAEEAHQKLMEAITALPWRYRTPIVLYEIEGLSYEAIARILECREGTVKSRISRGRQRLRTRLGPYMNGGSA
jgi:RNA polymerase sigma-70 factor (ECF subfamily)